MQSWGESSSPGGFRKPLYSYATFMIRHDDGAIRAIRPMALYTYSVG